MPAYVLEIGDRGLIAPLQVVSESASGDDFVLIREELLERLQELERLVGVTHPKVDGSEHHTRGYVARVDRIRGSLDPRMPHARAPR